MPIIKKVIKPIKAAQLTEVSQLLALLCLLLLAANARTASRPPARRSTAAEALLVLPRALRDGQPAVENYPAAYVAK